jgi:membrane-associated protease RseP (regulator of RpoE activity)
MLNEPASTRNDLVPARAPQAPLSREELLQNELRQRVATVLMIEKETFLPSSNESILEQSPIATIGSQLVATFEGTLLMASEEAYEKLDALLAPLKHLPLFREAKPVKDEPPNPAVQHTVHIITGRVASAPPRPWWPNVLLFIATVLSVLFVGASLWVTEAGNNNPQIEDILQNLLSGWPYAVSLLLILGAHELGHYFAARHHKLAVTLPYFIPLPLISMFGTMGAFIQLRQPMKNRKMLLDVGAAGPLSGLIFAVPILFIGLAQARLMPITGGGLYEGDSLLYAGAKILTFGRFVPDGLYDVAINSSQLAWAGWTGLLVTALNLIPIGQLDGGHVLYSLIGERARKLYFPLLAVMIALVFVTDVWFIWVILLLFFGRVYATPLDMITPLDNRRRMIAILAMVVFILVFVPAPLTAVGDPGPLTPAPRGSAAILPLIAPAIVMLQSRLRW